MERRGSNTWLVAALAVAVGFLAALLIFRGDDNNNTSATVNGTTATTAAGTGTTSTGSGTTTTSTTATAPTPTAAPGSPEASVGNCINLWNQANNRGDQLFLVNIMSH